MERAKTPPKPDPSALPSKPTAPTPKMRGDFADIERDWLKWQLFLFPHIFTAPPGLHHIEFWDWLWAIRKGVRPQPWIGIWPRGGGKSQSAEVGVVALGARNIRRYFLYICHEVGTRIFDPSRPDLGWHLVETHPTARVVSSDGFEVTVAGLPRVMSERVTPEHRYWAVRIATRGTQNKKTKQIDTMYGQPHWVEAQHLDWNTWIGHPIDTTVSHDYPMLERTIDKTKGREAIPYPRFADADFWWMVGLWWGDGTMATSNGSYYSHIEWACGDDHPDVKDKLCKILRSYGYEPTELRRKDKQGRELRCTNVGINDSILARWLFTWKKGRNRKEPPVWVERLSLDLQRELLLGYLAADACSDARGVHLVSIHLPGLLSVRRMLSRLGVVSTIIQSRKAKDAVKFPGGTYPVAAAYTLHIEHTDELGIPSTVRSRRHQMRVNFIRDGVLWSRVQAVGPCGEIQAVPIQTESHTYFTAYGLSHNCDSQDRADAHVQAIGDMLESEEIAMWYPDMADRAVGKFGTWKGWRRNRLHTRSNFIVDALGLDVAARGLKVANQRPDGLVFDDIDDSNDAPETTARKIEALTRRILPATTNDAVIIGIQNLIHHDSIFAQLADDRAAFLADRIVSGPIPAITDLTYETRVEEGGRPSIVITGGTPTWEGLDIDACANEITKEGISVFLSELQHITPELTGGMFDSVMFRHCRMEDVPQLDRTTVWVDPAVTAHDDSDACGIQVDGIDRSGTVYRLWSYEQRATPRKVIEIGLRKALEYEAHHVGVETDQGGLAWNSVFAEVRRELGPKFTHITMRSIKAGSGYGNKVHRAGQMLAAYEKGEIIHVMGTHDLLERALVRFPKTKPYDLVDAAVWSLHDLRRLSRPAKLSSASAHRLPDSRVVNGPSTPSRLAGRRPTLTVVPYPALPPRPSQSRF